MPILKINIKFWFKKYGIKIIGFLFFTYLGVTLQGPINTFNKALLDRLNPSLSYALSFIVNILSLKIPAYALIFSYIVLWIFYKIYNYFLIKSRTLKIVEARYGSGNTFVDIAGQLNNAVENNKLKIVLSNNIVGDPTPGIVKKGIIRYKFGNKIMEKEYKENETIDLPEPK